MQRSHDAELNASLMSMVQQLVLEDERIACLIVGVKSTVNVCNQRQLMQLMPHPVFGKILSFRNFIKKIL
jgi:hypothetical protein